MYMPIIMQKPTRRNKVFSLYNAIQLLGIEAEYDCKITYNESRDFGISNSKKYQLEIHKEDYRVMSVIQSTFSYGGKNDLLEAWNGYDEPEGHLTTIEALEYILKTMKENRRQNAEL